MSNNEQITVHCEPYLGSHHDYPDGAAWKVDEFGNLRVIGLGDKGLATYPPGRWLWVERTLQAPKEAS